MPQMGSAGPSLGQRALGGIVLLTFSGVKEGSAWDRLWRNARVPRLGDQNPPEVVAQITEQQDLLP